MNDWLFYMQYTIWITIVLNGFTIFWLWRHGRNLHLWERQISGWQKSLEIRETALKHRLDMVLLHEQAMRQDEGK